MRAASTLFIAIAFALSINAETAAKPAISEYVVNCYNDISSATKQFHLFAKTLGEYKEGDSYDIIHHEEQIIESHLKSAGTNCCLSDTDDFTDDESIEGIHLITTYGTSSDYALVLAQAMQPEISAKPSIAALLSDDISALSSQNDALFVCLEKKSPPKYLEDVKDFGSYVKESYDAAKAAFAPQEK